MFSQLFKAIGELFSFSFMLPTPPENSKENTSYRSYNQNNISGLFISSRLVKFVLSDLSASCVEKLSSGNLLAINKDPEIKRLVRDYCIIDIKPLESISSLSTCFSVTTLPVKTSFVRNASKGFKHLGEKEERFKKEIITYLYSKSTLQLKNRMAQSCSVERRGFSTYVSNYDGNVSQLLIKIINLC